MRRAVEPVTEEVTAVEIEEPMIAEAARAPAVTSRLSFLRPGSPVPVVVGVVLLAAGFGMVAYTWGRVAGLTNVALQLPYLVSGGLTALGLILVGLTVVNIAARRQDAADRARQMEQLSNIVRELERAEEPRPRSRTRKR